MAKFLSWRINYILRIWSFYFSLTSFLNDTFEYNAWTKLRVFVGFSFDRTKSSFHTFESIRFLCRNLIPGELFSLVYYFFFSYRLENFYISLLLEFDVINVSIRWIKSEQNLSFPILGYLHLCLGVIFLFYHISCTKSI